MVDNIDFKDVRDLDGSVIMGVDGAPMIALDCADCQWIGQLSNGWNWNCNDFDQCLGIYCIFPVDCEVAQIKARAILLELKAHHIWMQEYYDKAYEDAADIEEEVVADAEENDADFGR